MAETPNDGPPAIDEGPEDSQPAATAEAATAEDNPGASDHVTPGLGDDLLAGRQETESISAESAPITANDLLPPADLFASSNSAAGDFGVVGGGPEELGGDFATVDEPETGAEASADRGPSTLRARAYDYVVEGPPARQALSVASLLAAILERIDAPFARCGNRLRNAIGILALATLGTSIIVFIVTLF